MKEKTYKYSEAYINGNIGLNEYSCFCADLYEESLRKIEGCFDFDSLVILPFIHEFAYWDFSEEELKERVLYFVSILKGEQSYSHFSFLKIPIPTHENPTEYMLYSDFENIELKSMNSLFLDKINPPLSVKDVLYNSIIDLLSAVDWRNPEDVVCDCVNCNASYLQVKDRIKLLLSYYLGIKEFIFQVEFLPDNKVIYAVL